MRPLLIFSPDSHWLAVAGIKETILYEPRSARPVWSCATPAHVLSIAFSPDSTRLSVGLENQQVILWRIDDGSLQAVLRGPQNGVESLALSPDGQLLAAGYSGLIALWRTNDGTLVRRLNAMSGTVSSLIFTQDGQHLLSTQLGALNPHQVEPMTVSRWRVGDGALEQTLPGPAAYLTALTAAGPMLAAVGVDGLRLLLWRVTTEPSPRPAAAYPRQASIGSELTALAFSVQGDFLIGGTKAGEVWLWRVADGTLLNHYAASPALVGGVEVSPDGTVIDHNLAPALVSGVALSPDGNLLTTVSADGSVRIWLR